MGDEEGAARVRISLLGTCTMHELAAEDYLLTAYCVPGVWRTVWEPILLNLGKRG